MSEPIVFGSGEILSAIETDGKIKIFLLSGNKVIEKEYIPGADRFTAKADIVVSLCQNYCRCINFAVENNKGRLQNAKMTL